MAGQQKGFTIIEVMIVVAIIGILAGIAMASYIDYTRRTANGACLAETRGQLASVMIALADNSPVPTFKTTACEWIVVAADNKSLTAYPVSPGNKGILCDLDSSTICVVSDTVQP
jgi:type IV pilus assembly protein PilA